MVIKLFKPYTNFVNNQQTAAYFAKEIIEDIR